MAAKSAAYSTARGKMAAKSASYSKMTGKMAAKSFSYSRRKNGSKIGLEQGEGQDFDRAGQDGSRIGFT